MIETRYHGTVNVLQELLEDGSAKAARAPFDRPKWFALLQETGLTPLIASASDGMHRAALALSEDQDKLTSLRNWYSFTWRPLVSPDEDGKRLLCELASQLKLRAHRVTLEPVPDEDASASALASAFSKAGWRVEVTQCDTNHVLYVKGRSFDEYWAARPGRLRTTLKRKGKKVTSQILTQFDEAAWDTFEQIYKASWKPEEDHPQMLRKFAAQEGEAGRLRLGLASTPEGIVAAQFWTVENGIAYIHKLAHLESATKLSPGTTLSAELFRHTIDNDHVKTIDFGTGTQSYKSDWMEETRPRYRVDCFNLSRPRGWIDLARLTLRRLNEPNPPALAPCPPHG